MPLDHTIPANEFESVSSVQYAKGIRDRQDALVYFLCNVGDGDTQVLLLPHNEGYGHRLALVVDVSSFAKAAAAINWATEQGLLSPRHRSGHKLTQSEERKSAEQDIALVVASHPHADHIDGMPRFLATYRDRISEFWDPGYYHSIGAYHDTMSELAASPHIAYSNPTSGYRKWLGQSAISVLGPSIHLRNRYDSYGVEANDASITLQIETPVPRVIKRDNKGNRVESGARNVLILGADAQSLSWAHVLIDYPELRKSESSAAKAIGAAQGDRDLLRAGLHKVAHHGSKHGINLELAERIRAKLTLVSCVRAEGRHGFPHGIAQHILREAVYPQARAGGIHRPEEDPIRGLFYTGDQDDSGNDLGTIGVVMRAGKLEMWRFGDGTDEPLDLNGDHQRRWKVMLQT